MLIQYLYFTHMLLFEAMLIRELTNINFIWVNFDIYKISFSQFTKSFFQIHLRVVWFVDVKKLCEVTRDHEFFYMPSFSNNRISADLLNLYLSLLSLDNLFFNVDRLPIQVLDHLIRLRLKWISDVIFEKVYHCDFGKPFYLMPLDWGDVVALKGKLPKLTEFVRITN